MEIRVILKMFPCTKLYIVMQYIDLQQTPLLVTRFTFSDSNKLQNTHVQTHTQRSLQAYLFLCIASMGQLGLIVYVALFDSPFLTKTHPIAIPYKIYLDLNGTKLLKVSDQSASAYVPTHTNY